MPNLTDAAKAVTLSWAGFGLRALGRLREAAQPMQASLEELIRKKDWKQAAGQAGNLSELHLTLGDVAGAVSFARNSVDFADRSGDGFQKESKRTTLADALHQAGELAEAMQRQRQPQYRFLYSLPGFRFCDLLLAQGEVKEVLERAEQTLEWAIQHQISLLWIALDKLSLGRACLLEELTSPSVPLQRGKPRSIPPLRGDTGGCKKAATYLNQAVAGLREAGEQRMIPFGLFARARYYRLLNQFRLAWQDLDEAREIAKRGEMKLWLVDYHLHATLIVNGQLRIDNCELIVDGGGVSLGREEMIGRMKMHVEQAAKLVEETGYHRRDAEVELGFAGLFLAQGEQEKARERLARAQGMLEEKGIREWDFELKWLGDWVNG